MSACVSVSINSKGKKGINPNKAASIVVWLAFDFFSLNYKKFDFLVCFLKRSYFVTFLCSIFYSFGPAL